MIEAPECDVRAVRLLAAKRRIKNSFRAFFLAFPPHPDYKYGRHTDAMLDIFGDAIASAEQGKSRYIIVNVPPRHGKSDIASRRFPSWVLTKHPNWEVILATYNYDLAAEMSIDARRCFRDSASIYGVEMSEDRNQIGAWKTTAGGGLFAAGIGGTITGRGAHVLILDDYMKNREEAESTVMRDRVMDSFKSDLMTRLAPVHTVIIPANRWHEDDLVGRIMRKNNPKSEAYDPDFPKFETVRFPAQGLDGSWLFPERFSDEWYRAEKALIGSYAWAAQFQQDPRPRTGNLFRVDNIRYIETPEALPKGIRFVRAWDLASTQVERTSNNPDYTVGIKVGEKDGLVYVTVSSG